jgi:ADP-ribosylglycohydrolase
MPWSLKEMCPKAFDDDFLPKYDSPAGRVPYNSWGNGSAMRVSPVGWFFDTLQETETVAKISAEITHNHPEGIKGAQATAAAIWMARNGKSKAEIKEYIETKYGYDLNRTWEYLNQRYGWKSSCQETVPEAIIAFLESDSFEDAIRKAVSMGGDSDTLACITGGIAEAFYGDIPMEMVEPTRRVFPPIFDKIINAMILKTPYGSTNEEYD